jgi:hypothetical protein
MNREDIIRMAKEAGMDYLQYISPEAFEKVVVFSKLVAQHEHEAILAVIGDNQCECRCSEVVRDRGKV